MIKCPNCGQAVPETQRFCGNCGADVQAAAAFRPPALTVAPPAYGAPQGMDFFDATPPQRERPPVLTLTLLMVGVGILCLCCGLLVGGMAMYWLGPVQQVPVTPTPGPASALGALLWH